MNYVKRNVKIVKNKRKKRKTAFEYSKRLQTTCEFLENLQGHNVSE